MTIHPVNLRPEAGSRGGIRRDRRARPPGEGLPLPEWARGAIIYCAYPRAFSPSGHLDGVTARLPEIAALGARILWLLPIHPVGIASRKGRLGSPYAIRDYGTVNPEYGDSEALRRLVGEAHRLGLRVILDLVLNHAAPDNPLGVTHPDWFRRNRHGVPTRRVRGWWDVVDWNFGAPGLGNALLEFVEYWVREFDIDGYRCDVAGMVPAEFWRQARARLLSIKPDHFMLAEWDDPGLHLTAFHASYDWALYRAIRPVTRGRRPASDLVRQIESRHLDFPPVAQPLRFVENHDERRAPERFGRRADAALVFTMLAGGLPLIYNGQEVGARHRPSLFDRESIDWNPPGAARTRERLVALLRMAGEFQDLGPPVAIPGGSSHRVAAYRRTGAAGRALIVAASFGGQFEDLPSALRRETAGLEPRSLPPGGRPDGGDGRLEPGGVRIWTS